MAIDIPAAKRAATGKESTQAGMLLFLRSCAAWPDQRQRTIGLCGSRMTERRQMFAILHTSAMHDTMLKLGMTEAWSQSLDRFGELLSKV